MSEPRTATVTVTASEFFSNSNLFATLSSSWRKSSSNGHRCRAPSMREAEHDRCAGVELRCASRRWACSREVPARLERVDRHAQPLAQELRQPGDVQARARDEDAFGLGCAAQGRAGTDVFAAQARQMKSSRLLVNRSRSSSAWLFSVSRFIPMSPSGIRRSPSVSSLVISASFSSASTGVDVHVAGETLADGVHAHPDRAQGAHLCRRRRRPGPSRGVGC